MAVDLSAAVTASLNPVVVGQALTYSVEVEIHGATNAADVTVTDDLPAGVTFVSAELNQREISPAGGAIAASFGNVPADTILGTLTITVIPNVANPTLSDTVSVNTSSGDTDPSNNSATATTTVNAAGTASADLSVPYFPPRPAAVPKLDNRRVSQHRANVGDPIGRGRQQRVKVNKLSLGHRAQLLLEAVRQRVSAAQAEARAPALALKRTNDHRDFDLVAEFEVRGRSPVVDVDDGVVEHNSVGDDLDFFAAD